MIRALRPHYGCNQLRPARVLDAIQNLLRSNERFGISPVDAKFFAIEVFRDAGSFLENWRLDCPILFRQGQTACNWLRLKLCRTSSGSIWPVMKRESFL